MTEKRGTQETNIPETKGVNRRQFLGTVGKGAAIGALAPMAFKGVPSAFASAGENQVKKRRLGKTELMISEVGIGAHTFSNWVKDCSDKQAIELLASARDMGVNHIDADNPDAEHTIPSKAMKALNARNDFILSVRDVRCIEGNKDDLTRINAKVEQRLQNWGVDHFDLLFMGTVFNDFVDHRWAIEALTKWKEKGVTRFIGFGCHFSRDNYLKCIDLYGDTFDVTSLPYNPFHRGAEEVFPAIAEKDLGVIAIKPFAAGSLLKDKDLEGADKDLPRNMLAYILANKNIHSVIPGYSSVAQGEENFSASWNPLTAAKKAEIEEIFPAKMAIPGASTYYKDRPRPEDRPADGEAPGARGEGRGPKPAASNSKAAGTFQMANAHTDWLKGWEKA